MVKSSVSCFFLTYSECMLVVVSEDGELKCRVC